MIKDFTVLQLYICTFQRLGFETGFEESSTFSDPGSGPESSKNVQTADPKPDNRALKAKIIRIYNYLAIFLVAFTLTLVKYKKIYTF